MNSKKVYAGLIKLIVFMALLVCLIVLVFNLAGMLAQDGSALAAMTLSSAYTSPTPAPTPTPTPSPTPEMTPLPEFNPKAGPNANPAPVIYSTAILKDGQLLDSYQADEAHTMDFGAPEDYTEAKGIITFRGNNFRTTAQYGETVITQRNFGNFWRHGTSGLSDSGGSYWGGSGWTGQPLIVEWPRETRQIMNMYDWAKEKDGLVEVIYATLDGHVYFMDLETGEDTRDSIFLGYSFKGAGALDPRGYPLMYVGGGLVNGSGSSPRFMVVSLIDGEILYSEGANDSFAPRSWSAFDSSALVDAETDQLIYPGENGVIYIVKLNTNYDPQAGTISIDPEEIKFTFKSSTADKFYYGMEDSAIAWRGHLIIADNGADFVCIDLNTLEIEWRFDCLDDTNCTAVMELDETGHPYVYLSTSFHMGWRSSSTATIPVWKIDAVTGEEVWHHDYTCYSESGLSGGVQGSLTLGTGELEGILYVPMAREGDWGSGKLLALDKDTGEEIWTYNSSTYSWSTPTCVYDQDGKGYVLYTSSIQGNMYLLDGLTGESYATFPFGCTVEASPVVYNNTIVIGTRNNEIYGITLE